jgi:hypothetical protein
MPGHNGVFPDLSVGQLPFGALYSSNAAYARDSQNLRDCVIAGETCNAETIEKATDPSFSASGGGCNYYCCVACQFVTSVNGASGLIELIRKRLFLRSKSY